MVDDVALTEFMTVAPNKCNISKCLIHPGVNLTFLQPLLNCTKIHWVFHELAIVLHSTLAGHKKFLRRKLQAFQCWIDLFFSSLFTFPQIMQEIKKPKKNSYWYAKLDWIHWLSKRVSLHPRHLLQYLHEPLHFHDLPPGM
jgi:hypothetical protein